MEYASRYRWREKERERERERQMGQVRVVIPFPSVTAATLVIQLFLRRPSSYAYAYYGTLHCDYTVYVQNRNSKSIRRLVIVLEYIARGTAEKKKSHAVYFRNFQSSSAVRNPVAVTLIRLCAQAEEVIGFYGALQARPINRRRDGPFKRELPRGSRRRLTFKGEWI